MIKIRMIALILAVTGFYASIAFGAEAHHSKHGKKNDKTPVTYIDMSAPSAPESTLPTIADKGKL